MNFFKAIHTSIRTLHTLIRRALEILSLRKRGALRFCEGKCGIAITKPFALKKYAQAALFLFIGIFILAISSHLKIKRQGNTVKIKEQHSVLQEIQEEHFAFLQKDNNVDGALARLLKSVEKAHSLRSITTIVKKERNIGKVKSKAQKVRALGESGLSQVDLSFDFNVENDRNIFHFMNILKDKTPGIVVFKSISIKRTQQILPKDKFLAILEKYKSAGKKHMIFNANVRCEAVIPTKYVKSFLE
jgi:hypothetical protein